jgi:deaminated glutathione amidase
MKLAISQMLVSDEKRANLELIGERVAAAASAGARLVAFPEYAMYVRSPVGDGFADAAEALDGDFCAALSSFAARYQIHVVCGILEMSDTPAKPYNTLVVFDSAGALICSYRKLHLYNAFGGAEDNYLTAGDELAPRVFVVDELRVGLMTCYDLRFPEIGRVLADAGAELVLVPSCWTPGVRKEDHWSVLSRARAIENAYFVAGVCQAPPISTGGSLLADPMGVICSSAGETEALLLADVESERVVEVRSKMPVLSSRRYGVTSNGIRSDR